MTAREVERAGGGSAPEVDVARPALYNQSELMRWRHPA
jgi:hypothetical protein